MVFGSDVFPEENQIRFKGCGRDSTLFNLLLHISPVGGHSGRRVLKYIGFIRVLLLAAVLATKY